MNLIGGGGRVPAGVPESEGWGKNRGSVEVVVGLLGVMGTMPDNRSWSCWGTLSVGID